MSVFLSLYGLVGALLLGWSGSADATAPVQNWEWSDPLTVTPTGMWFQIDRQSVMCVPVPMQSIKTSEKIALARGGQAHRTWTARNAPSIVIKPRYGKLTMAYARQADCQSWLRYIHDRTLP
ncbi:MAG: hypothetical protein ACK5NY_07935 [Burkholderiaceae bacterium]